MTYIAFLLKKEDKNRRVLCSPERVKIAWLHDFHDRLSTNRGWKISEKSVAPLQYKVVGPSERHGSHLYLSHSLCTTHAPVPAIERLLAAPEVS